MKNSVSTRQNSRRKRKNTNILKAVAFILMFILLAAAVAFIIFDSRDANDSGSSGLISSSGAVILEPNDDNTQSAADFKTGYIASSGNPVNVISRNYITLASLPRGTTVSYSSEASDFTNYAAVQLEDGTVGYVPSANITDDPGAVLEEKTIFVRTSQNLCSEDGFTLGTLVNKGAELQVIGYDSLNDDGSVNKYRVSYNGEEGYIRAKYVTTSAEAANAVYDEAGTYQTHASRENRYGGGDAASLDFFPREKQSFGNNVMPEECRTLYICGSAVKNIDAYIELADSTGINAFVVDIVDGTAVSYPSPVMQEYSPTAYGRAICTLEEYQQAIQKLKDAGYYVIGRITAFNDSNLVADYPECAITDNNGAPLSLSRGYWPSAYDRRVWQYKVELAVDAVETMGFNEIQFDYVRFPDGTRSLESAGTIDYNNTYGETKAQAIQRFLMYACDMLHEYGVYVSADVFGESAYTYVTAYGQYWAAISNVVDVISGMPYPDHFAASGDYLPWTHPYETLNSWAESVVLRQAETASPAIVRTWIQAYNAIKSPYNTYGVHEVTEEIRGLRDAGHTGGYMTWNGSSDIAKYRELAEAFNY